MQEVIVFVEHHAEDVAVSADEDIGCGEFQLASKLIGVMTRPTADMGHQNTKPVAHKEVDLREFVVKSKAVAIAPNGTNRLEGAEPIEHSGTYVACMPQFVAVFEEGEDLRRKGSVCIGNDSYSLHSLAFISARFSLIISLR